ncbi:hypothetical protein BGZ60DRAFT_563558 [Tricladium varicosporioides]|nr:hypothetical protein BGZ60DRAFT_563558 [Hymenoscyphus varicosporioides]
MDYDISVFGNEGLGTGLPARRELPSSDTNDYGTGLESIDTSQAESLGLLQSLAGLGDSVGREHSAIVKPLYGNQCLGEDSQSEGMNCNTEFLPQDQFGFPQNYVPLSSLTTTTVWTPQEPFTLSSSFPMPQTLTMRTQSALSPNSKARHKQASYVKQRSLGKSRKRVYRRQQLGCMVDQCPSRTHTSGTSIASVRRALASFEFSLSALSNPSTYFRGTSEALVLQLKQLLDSEELLGNLQDDTNDGIASNTDQGSEESLSTSDVVDSEYSTDNTSVSSFSEHLSDDASPTTSRAIKTPRSFNKAPQSFPCTFIRCRRSFKAFSDWKRHEETHYPQEHFMCLRCIEPPFQFNGNAVCGFCNTVFGPLSNLPAHYLYCESAQQGGKTFARRDKMTAHLRECHIVESTAAKDLSEDWKYPILSDWPRQCSFCAKIFQTWGERLLHLADHFKPRDDRPSKHFKYYKDNDSDDDDDFNDDHPSRQQAPGGKTVSSTIYGHKPKAQQASDHPNNIPWGQSQYNAHAPTAKTHVLKCLEENPEGPKCGWTEEEKLGSHNKEIYPIAQHKFDCHFRSCRFWSVRYSDYTQHIKDTHKEDYFTLKNNGKIKQKHRVCSTASDLEPLKPTNTQIQNIDKNSIPTPSDNDNNLKEFDHCGISQDKQSPSALITSLLPTQALGAALKPIEYRNLSLPLERWLRDRGGIDFCDSDYIKSLADLASIRSRGLESLKALSHMLEEPVSSFEWPVSKHLKDRMEFQPSLKSDITPTFTKECCRRREVRGISRPICPSPMRFLLGDSQISYQERQVPPISPYNILMSNSYDLYQNGECSLVPTSSSQEWRQSTVRTLVSPVKKLGFNEPQTYHQSRPHVETIKNYEIGCGATTTISQPSRFNSKDKDGMTGTQKTPQLLGNVMRRELLTSYKVFTIRKTNQECREKSTWAKASITQDQLPETEILRDIKKLNHHGPSVAEKKSILAPRIQRQIGSLLDDLIAQDHDPNFEWLLVQLYATQRCISKGLKRETVSVSVYVSRTPREISNPTTHIRGEPTGQLKSCASELESHSMRSRRKKYKGKPLYLEGHERHVNHASSPLYQDSASLCKDASSRRSLTTGISSTPSLAERTSAKKSASPQSETKLRSPAFSATDKNVADEREQPAIGSSVFLTLGNYPSRKGVVADRTGFADSHYTMVKLIPLETSVSCAGPRVHFCLPQKQEQNQIRNTETPEQSFQKWKRAIALRCYSAPPDGLLPFPQWGVLNPCKAASGISQIVVFKYIHQNNTKIRVRAFPRLNILHQKGTIDTIAHPKKKAFIQHLLALINIPYLLNFPISFHSVLIARSPELPLLLGNWPSYYLLYRNSASGNSCFLQLPLFIVPIPFWGKKTIRNDQDLFREMAYTICGNGSYQARYMNNYSLTVEQSLRRRKVSVQIWLVFMCCSTSIFPLTFMKYIWVTEI